MITKQPALPETEYARTAMDGGGPLYTAEQLLAYGDERERAGREDAKVKALVETARRVLRKYGAESDWTEWRDVADALTALAPKENAK